MAYNPFHIRKFCCCCGLRLGTCFIGFLFIFFSVILILSEAKQVWTINNVDMKHEMQISVQMSFINIILACGLIGGALKNSRYCLLPWLVTSPPFMTSLSFVAIALTFINKIFIITVFIMGCWWYFWLCVLNFYRELSIRDMMRGDVTAGAVEISMCPHASSSQSDLPPSYEEATKPIVRV